MAHPLAPSRAAVALTDMARFHNPYAEGWWVADDYETGENASSESGCHVGRLPWQDRPRRALAFDEHLTDQPVAMRLTCGHIRKFRPPLPGAGEYLFCLPCDSASRCDGRVGSVVYFALSPDRLLKIGTTTNTAQRMGDLACTLICEFPGSYAAEARLLRHFASSKANTGKEYFVWSRPVAEFVAQLAGLTDSHNPTTYFDEEGLRAA